MIFFVAERNKSKYKYEQYEVSEKNIEGESPLLKNINRHKQNLDKRTG